MTKKEKMIRAARSLSAKASSLEDAMERLLLLAKIERDFKQADAGRTFSHRKAKDKLVKSLTFRT